MTASIKAAATVKTYSSYEAAERAAVRDCKRHGESTYSVDATHAPMPTRGQVADGTARGEFRTDRAAFRFDYASA